MDNGLPVLVVSCRPENRKLLMHLFDGLPIDAYSALSIQQAKEALQLRPFSLLFCEERLSDGSYTDLLRHVHLANDSTRFVVLLCTGEWEAYLEALRLGGEEVLRCPLRPTNIDLALIHAMRPAKTGTASHAA